ncbi:MAG: hypothetical protein U0Q03_15760 [Acidimicrobiales bacterium]
MAIATATAKSVRITLDLEGDASLADVAESLADAAATLRLLWDRDVAPLDVRVIRMRLNSPLEIVVGVAGAGTAVFAAAKAVLALLEVVRDWRPSRETAAAGARKATAEAEMAELVVAETRARLRAEGIEHIVVVRAEPPRDAQLMRFANQLSSVEPSGEELGS